MQATGFQRPAAALFAAVSVAATIAAFAIGQARAQMVNPPPPPPPPVFNPIIPNTVPQPPPVPVSPAPPSGLGSAPAPAIVPVPAVPPQTANAPAAAKPALSPRHVRRHGAGRHRWSRRHARYHAPRVLGPSYYPGLGEFYPPYPNPCHFSRLWSGYYAGYPTYTCSW
jgi:hypothetical protein